jgi:hypothetical protein
MNLGLAISYNGLQINTETTQAGGLAASGYRVEQITVSPIDVVQKIDKRALQDGLDAQDVFLGGRHISAIVTALGSTQGDFWDRAQVLLSTFSPTLAYASNTANLGFLALDFFQPTANIATWPTSAYPNGIPLRYYCRPYAVPSYAEHRNDEGGVATKGLAKAFSVSLIARDPRKYVQTQQVVTIGTSVSTATNRGDYPVLPQITISSGTATGLMTVTIGSSVFTVNVDQTGGYDYVLDCQAQTLRKNGVLTMYLLSAGSAFPSLPAGGTAISRTAVGNATASMAYRDAFA